MKLAAAYPMIEGYKAEARRGYYFHFEDPMQFHQLERDGQRVAVRRHGRQASGCTPTSNIKTLNWKLRYWHNDADFYDLFGPVERSRKGDAFIVSYNKTKIYDPPRQLDLFGIGGGLFRARAAAVGAEHRQPEEHLLGRGRRPIHQHPQVAGRRRP